MKYAVILTRRARKDLLSLEKDIFNRVSESLRLLEEDPFPRNVRKILGRVESCRLRVGDYRVLYEGTMMDNRLCFLVYALLTLLTLMGSAFAKEEAVAGKRPVEVLWEKGAPLAKGENDKSRITICLPDPSKATPVGVVVCPGGGYGGQAMDHEGYQVADWLNSQGISAFILEYRVGGGENVHPAPLLDAQRAIRTVRARAAEFKIDPARIGILGFSAGGHLTSTAGTHFDAGDPKAEDPIDRGSCRPDFMVLVYPVITMTFPYTHEGSRRNLLGENPDEALVNLLSNEKQVTAETPPAFLVHSTEDKAVPSENSVQFYLAMKAAGVPVELHLFEKGPHGFGLAPSDPALSVWPGMCVQWLRGRGILDP